MLIHHIFIFTKNPSALANELLDFGFLEGSNRTHKGQGTQNRKFHFENFFLEVLWVHSQQELLSPLTKSVFLHKRANTSTHSPFGLCLHHKQKHNELFKDALIYKPLYLPPNMQIEVLAHENNPSLPWTFRWQNNFSTKPAQEPLNHLNGIQKLTHACFGVKKLEKPFTQAFINTPSLGFEQSSEPFLTLTFDEAKQNKSFNFKNAKLKIFY